MVVTSTTVSHTVLATFLGVEVGILSQAFSGTTTSSYRSNTVWHTLRGLSTWRGLQVF